MFRNQRGESNTGSMIAVVLLVIALITVFFLWQNDRESADASLEVDIGLDVPAAVRLV